MVLEQDWGRVEDEEKQVNIRNGQSTTEGGGEADYLLGKRRSTVEGQASE